MLNIDETDASCVSCAAPGAGADAAAKTERAIVMVRALIRAGNPNGNKHESRAAAFLSYRVADSAVLVPFERKPLVNHARAESRIRLVPATREYASVTTS